MARLAGEVSDGFHVHPAAMDVLIRSGAMDALDPDAFLGAMHNISASVDQELLDTFDQLVDPAAMARLPTCMTASCETSL